MKHLIISFLTCLMALLPASAKQIMTMVNGDEIEVEIVSLGTSEISYKKASNPDGPTYTTTRDKVFFITYEDGSKEVITPLDHASTNTSAQKSNGSIGGLVQSGLQLPPDPTQEKDYFPGIKFYPRAAVGFHATPSGYKDQYDIDWGGLSWAFDINVLFPLSNTSAWSVGIGLSGLGGDMNMLYVQKNENHKDKMGSFDTMYFTIPIQYWYKGCDWFMFGFGNRIEILVSQKMEGEKIEDAFNVMRDAFLIDGVFSFGNFDLGAQVLFNLTSAMKGEDLDWSPTIGLNVTAGYRF